MAQQNPELTQLWTRLSECLNRIFDLKPVSTDEFMSLYNAVDRYFRSPEYSNHVLRERTRTVPPPANTNQEERLLPGGELYYNACAFFRDYLENIAQKDQNREGEGYLEFYAKIWHKYQFSSQVANGILQMINQNWVDRRRGEGAKHIHKIWTVAMHIWQDVFFKESNHALTQTCLRLINNERDGSQINSSLIRQVVDSYVSAGVNRTGQDLQQIEQALQTYVEYFEKLFLEETKQFYKKERNDITKDSIIDYVKKVNKRINQEESRAKAILHPTTLEKIKPLLEQIFIADRIETMQEELKTSLINEKIEEIRLLFNLVNRIPGGNNPIRDFLQDFAKEEALKAIEGISSQAIKDPKVYVETIIAVYLRFLNIVDDGFSSHPDYLGALDRAFGSVVNNNAVTRNAGRSTRSPELLAAYCDILLRKGNKLDDNQIEEKLKEIMMVFNYVEDKDAFQKFYGKMLAKRLVGQLSASDDYEESMISKLKQACGFEYTSKLQRMFQDIGVSKNLIDQYRTYCEKRNLQDIVDFSVMVLSSNSWPFSPPTTFTLPAELQSTLNSFTNFYTETYQGKQLKWLHQSSKGEVQTLYTKPKITLQVSIYQMSILLLFNSSDNLQVEEIRARTAIEDDVFLQVLLSLLKSGVLKCLQVNASEINDTYSEKNLREEYSIQVDESYKSKRVKVNVNVPLKPIDQKESEKDDKQVTEDRKNVIQAYIVRIMKSRKELKHSLLIQEVIEKLSSRFKPKVPMIKQNIEVLIEKEYLERDSKERDLLYYKA